MVPQSAGGALPPSDTDLLDNFAAVSPVMGQDKLPAPPRLSRLLGRTGLSRTGTVCFIAFVQCAFLLEVRVLSWLMSVCYNYVLYLLPPPCLATIPWRPFGLLRRPLNLHRLHYATHFLNPSLFNPFSSSFVPFIHVRVQFYFYSKTTRSKFYASLFQTFFKV